MGGQEIQIKKYKIQDTKYVIALLMILFSGMVYSAEHDMDMSMDLLPDGNVPVWLTAGPFEQPVILFQGIADADSIGETRIEPFEGKPQHGAFNASGKTRWRVQSVNHQGYLDFNETIGWDPPGNIPEKIRDARAAYAYTQLFANHEKSLLLLTGSNARLKIWLNGNEVYNLQTDRAAIADQDTIRISLKKGKNNLLLKVGNSYKNYYMPFWGGIDWGWGVYARLLNPDLTEPEDIRITIPVSEKQTSLQVESTIFFRRSADKLLQELAVTIDNRQPDVNRALLNVVFDGQLLAFPLKNLRFGENRQIINVPALEQDQHARFMLKTTDTIVDTTYMLQSQPRYDLHFMMLSHMDIGYTHPQPVGEERHLKTLDEVLQQCEIDSQFSWTIEALRLLEAYERYRPSEKFEQLLRFIRDGRIAVSPLYSNPFTGWIDEGEMLHSLKPARVYAERYDIRYKGVIYNDTPGLNWILPQVLKEFGIKTLVCGINEIYGGYRIQKSIPKVFAWEGADGSRLPTYLCEAYTEGRTYGFEKNTAAMKNRIWYRTEKLRSAGYRYELILLDAAMTDNAGIPMLQYENAKEWREHYAYPRITISNLDKFAEMFTERYGTLDDTLYGDWTSDWDILNQGEPQRMIKQRQTQVNLLDAAKLNGLSTDLDPATGSLQPMIDDAYADLLHFSGHGSGLEYGFGSPSANELTMQFREQYTHNAWLKSEDILLRTLYRLTDPQVALDREGIIVYNTLSWRRDVAVEIEFPVERNAVYRIIDPESMKPIPVFRDGHRYVFMATNLPSLGYKKYYLTKDQETQPERNTGFSEGSSSLENDFFKIEFDPQRKRLLNIYSKSSGKNIFPDNTVFGIDQLMMKRLFESGFNAVAAEWEKLEIIDQRPVRMIIRQENDSALLNRLEWILWEDGDRIDIHCRLNLEVLESPEQAEEYVLPFLFNTAGAVKTEILGGFIDHTVERFPTVEHNALSMRRVVWLEDESYSIFWASPDARVVRIDTDIDSGRNVVLSNVINNFPTDWNRREKNEGFLEYRYAIKVYHGSEPLAEASRFGWETATPARTEYSWFNRRPLHESALNTDNPYIQLLSMESTEDPGTLKLYFINTDRIRSQVTDITSTLFGNKHIKETNLAGKTISTHERGKTTYTFRFRGGEIKTLLLSD